MADVCTEPSPIFPPVICFQMIPICPFSMSFLYYVHVPSICPSISPSNRFEYCGGIVLVLFLFAELYLYGIDAGWCLEIFVLLPLILVGPCFLLHLIPFNIPICHLIKPIHIPSLLIFSPLLIFLFVLLFCLSS